MIVVFYNFILPMLANPIHRLFNIPYPQPKGNPHE